MSLFCPRLMRCGARPVSLHFRCSVTWRAATVTAAVARLSVPGICTAIPSVMYTPRQTCFSTFSFFRQSQQTEKPTGRDRREELLRNDASTNSETPLPSASSRSTLTSSSTRTPSTSTDGLHEDIYTIPNFLTLTRLVAAPVVGYFVLHDQHAWAVGLFAYAGITDLLDGWIARTWNRKTVVGTIIDPMADKALMTILTVCLAVKGALPVWVATIILGRDIGLAIAAVYYRWISLPPPKTFARYWDFSLPSAEVRPTTISKYNTFLQLALVGLTTTAPLVHIDLGVALTTLQYIVATTTIWSGASYVFSKDAVKILSYSKIDSGDKR